MPTKKKRASFSSAAIPLRAIKETMEGSDDPVVVKPEKAIVDVPEPSPVIEPVADIESALLQDAEEPVLKKKNVVLYRVGIVFTGLVITASLVLLIVSITMSKNSMPVAVKVESTPTPQSTPAFNPETISIEVLNGSGVPGAAAKGAATLKTKGYTVAGTGNTKKTPESGVFISKSLSQESRVSLFADLASVFGISSSSGDLIDASVSARLIIGVK